MSTSVLFDLPGPKARARHRIYTVVAAALALVALGWVLWKLDQAGEFREQMWDKFLQENIARAYWQGLLDTLKAAGSAIVLSVVAGALLAVARLSDRGWIRWPAWAFVEFFRAVPLLLLIMFVYFGLSLGLYWSLVVALVLYNGSVLAEVFRAGIKAVPRGQSEAAYAIGLRKSQVMRLILLPQSVRIMLPAIISQCVIILKDTALGAIVAYQDLTFAARNIALYVHNFFVPLVTAAVIYILINYALSRLAVWVERRLSRRRDAAPARAEEPVESMAG